MAVFWGVFRYSAASKIAETSEKPKQGKFAEANKPNLPKQISRSKEKFWELQLERVRFSVETNRSVFCSSWILRLAKSFSPPPNRASAEAPLVSGRGRRARALYHSVPTTHTQVGCTIGGDVTTIQRAPSFVLRAVAEVFRRAVGGGFFLEAVFFFSG